MARVANPSKLQHTWNKKQPAEKAEDAKKVAKDCNYEDGLATVADSWENTKLFLNEVQSTGIAVSSSNWGLNMLPSAFLKWTRLA